MQSLNKIKKKKKPKKKKFNNAEIKKNKKKKKISSRNTVKYAHVQGAKTNVKHE